MSTRSVTTAVTSGGTISGQKVYIGDNHAVDVSTGYTGMGTPNTNYAADLSGPMSVASEAETGLYFRRWGRIGGPSGPLNPLWMLGRFIASPPLYKSEFRFIYYDDDVGVERAVYSLESTGTLATVLDGNLRSCFEAFLNNGDSSPAFRANAYPRMGIEFGAGGSSATDVGLRRREAGIAALDNGGAADGGAVLEFMEVSDPSAPAANTGRLYVRDNGAGKSQLCIRFNTGAIQVIATEP